MSALSNAPGSFDPLDSIPDSIIACAFCFASPADLPMLPDHPIYAALTQDPFPDPLNQLRMNVRMKEE